MKNFTETKDGFKNKPMTAYRHIVINDQGGGFTYCANCDMGLDSSDQCNKCPKCTVQLIGSKFFTQFGGLNF